MNVGGGNFPATEELLVVAGHSRVDNHHSGTAGDGLLDKIVRLSVP